MLRLLLMRAQQSYIVGDFLLCIGPTFPSTASYPIHIITTVRGKNYIRSSKKTSSSNLETVSIYWCQDKLRVIIWIRSSNCQCGQSTVLLADSWQVWPANTPFQFHLPMACWLFQVWFEILICILEPWFVVHRILYAILIFFVYTFWERLVSIIWVILRCWGNSSMVCQQNSEAL